MLQEGTGGGNNAAALDAGGFKAAVVEEATGDAASSHFGFQTDADLLGDSGDVSQGGVGERMEQRTVFMPFTAGESEGEEGIKV